MKTILSLLLTCTLLMGCASALADTEIIVFAAASMTETMNTIKERYEAANPGITVTYNFDSSGTHEHL